MSKPDKQKYWFKRRRYGYGWIPATWQGWTTLLIFLAIIIGNAAVITVHKPSDEPLWQYSIIFITSIFALIVIATVKGPTPKWRWGKRDDDNEDEDF